MPTVRAAPEIPEGVSKEASEAFAQQFLEQWVQFSPSNLDPKQAWFDSWDGQATAEFRREMRVQADGMWSWTWNQEKKTCCVDFPEPAESRLGDEEAVVKVPLTRYVHSLFATEKELTEQRDQAREEKTYLVWLTIDGETMKVSHVEEVDKEASLPEVGR